MLPFADIKLDAPGLPKAGFTEEQDKPTQLSIKDIDDKEGVASFIEENNGAIDIPDTIHAFLNKKGVTADSLHGQNTVSEIMLMAKNLSELRKADGRSGSDRQDHHRRFLPAVCMLQQPAFYHVHHVQAEIYFDAGKGRSLQ